MREGANQIKEHLTIEEVMKPKQLITEKVFEFMIEKVLKSLQVIALITDLPSQLTSKIVQ